ncbi:unnamed protein product [Lathyrus oleraceus]
MACHTNQSCFLSILCLVLMVSSGLVTSILVPPGGVCIGPCVATCDQDCRGKGFGKGGQCYTHLEKTTCCCFHQ